MNSRPNIPIYTPRIRLLLPIPKTNIQNRRAVLVRLQQPTAVRAGVVEVDVLVPGGDEQAQGSGRELDRGDGVGGGGGELELRWGCFVSLNVLKERRE
jgi:hypothetical protein